MSKTMIPICVILICVIYKHSRAMDNSTNWVFWNDWSYCKGLCGETGYMSRQRNHTTSSSVFCEFNNEWKTCHIIGCTEHNFTKNVEGNELRMQELNYIESFRSTNSIILDKCISDYCDYDTDQFWNAFLCVKHNLGCPVKGGWSKWSNWSKCTSTCGSGIQYRLRYCDHPKPSRTSLNCSGNYMEKKNCFGNSCTTKINGIWCKWSNWSQCSVHQGNGIVMRKRFCRHINSSSYTSCFGQHTEISECYIPDFDGGWSEWQTWSPCSAKCDKGTRYRMRSCSRPEPEGFGQGCIGESVQTSICHVEPCKGPPIMVVTFDKQSYLKYAATEINTTLLYVTIRFYPFDISGTILRRFNDNCEDCNSVQLSLINCRLFLTVVLDRHNVILSSSSTINNGWNEVSFAITKNKITLQLNYVQISKYVKCFASSSTMNLDQVMNIGEDFEGYIEQLNVNFIPYALTINNKFSDLYLPYAAFNTIFELSEERSYSDLSKTVKIPCSMLNNFWKLEMYMRFELLAHGNLILIKTITDYMSVDISKDIIKLEVKLDDYFDEVSIKFEEIDSSWIHIEVEQQENSWFIEVNGVKHSLIMPTVISNPNELCTNHLYIGHTKEDQNLTELRAIIGYLKLNNNILNLNNFLINPISDFNIFSYNVSDVTYNEVAMTNEEDEIELNCIFNYELEYEDLDIVWLKSNQLILHQMNYSNISNGYIIITNEHVSQIKILPKTIFDDKFYLCISMTKQKIICVYGITTFSNIIINTAMLKTFIFLGYLIVTITTLMLIIIVKRIKLL